MSSDIIIIIIICCRNDSSNYRSYKSPLFESQQITSTLSGGALLIFLQSRIGDRTYNLRSLLPVSCLRPLCLGDPLLYDKDDFSIYKTDCLYICVYLCLSFTRKPRYQSPPNFVQTSTPTQGRLLTQV